MVFDRTFAMPGPRPLRLLLTHLPLFHFVDFVPYAALGGRRTALTAALPAAHYTPLPYHPRLPGSDAGHNVMSGILRTNNRRLFLLPGMPHRYHRTTLRRTARDLPYLHRAQRATAFCARQPTLPRATTHHFRTFKYLLVGSYLGLTDGFGRLVVDGLDTRRSPADDYNILTNIYYEQLVRACSTGNIPRARRGLLAVAFTTLRCNPAPW